MSQDIFVSSLWIGRAGTAVRWLRRNVRVVAIVAGALLIAALAIRVLIPHRGQGEFLVRRGTLEPAVPLAGTLGAERSDTYGATVPGIEVKILWLAEEGTLVTAGDSLIQFDPAPFQRELDIARARAAELAGEADGAHLALEAMRLKRTLDLREKANSADDSARELEALVHTDAPLSAQESATELEQSDRALTDAAAKLEGLQPFVAEGYISQEEFRAAQTRRDQAAADLNLAKAKHAALLHRTTPDLIKKKTEEAETGRVQAELWKEKSRLELGQADAAARTSAARLEEATRQVADAQRKIAACSVNARAAGLVVHAETFDRGGVRRKLRVGDTVWGGTTVVTLPDLSRMVVEGRVPESQIHLLSRGNPVRIRLDAFPVLELRGTLRSLGGVGVAEGNSSRSFPVTIEVEGSDPRFRPGMVARCTVVGQAVRDVLFVPVDAVRLDERGSFVVVASRLGGTSVRRVRTGTSTSQFVEVREGLEEGEVVSVLAP